MCDAGQEGDGPTVLLDLGGLLLHVHRVAAGGVYTLLIDIGALFIDRTVTLSVEAIHILFSQGSSSLKQIQVHTFYSNSI